MEYRKISTQDFIKKLQDPNEETIKGYELDKLSSDQEIEITSNTTTCTIDSCLFNNGGFLSNVVVRGRLIFSNCVFEESEHEFEFRKYHRFEANEIIFETDNIFKCKINFNDINVPRVTIQGVFSSELIIAKFNVSSLSIRGITGKFSKFSDISFYDNVNIDYCLLRDLSLSRSLTFNNNTPQKLVIADGDYERIKFHNVNDVNYVRFQGGNKLKENLLIKYLEFEFLDLTGKINMRFLSVDTFVLSPFTNKTGSFRVQGVRFNRKVILNDSELDNSKFNDVDLYNAKVVFDRCDIMPASFSNIVWPKDHKVYTLFEANRIEREKMVKEDKYKAKREVYRQLKHAMKSQGNRIDALRFYRNEMESYWNYIQISKDINWTDRLLIRINYGISDFGQNWWRPLKLILLFNSLFFFLLILLNYKGLSITCDPSKMSWNAFNIGFKEYLSMFSPIRKIPQDMSSAMLLVDVFNRLFISFLIYHFVKATRRFSIL